MKKRFQVLRFIASIFRILAIFIAAAALVASLVTVVMALAGGQIWSIFGLDANTGFFGGLLAAFLEVLAGGLYALLLYGYGELISLMLALEENTHNTVLLLEKTNKVD
jgi:hypothetical protein